MMKTRRKSKAAAAAQDEEHLPSSPMHEDVPPLSLDLPDDIDQDILSSLLPDTILSSPSANAIITLYRLVVGQASDLDTSQRELDEVKAEAERKDVELDQALQDKETLSSELESTIEGLRQEVDQVKRERDQLNETNASLQSQVASLSSSQTSSSSEVESLKQRIEDTEREKRDLVGVVGRLKQENTQRDEEIQSLRSNLKEARQEHLSLETQVRELRSIETSTKFKVDSLTQQLQLAQSEVERTNEELTNKTQEFAKYRRAKHAEISTLQASYDSLSQSQASAEASLKALQSSHTSQSHQLSQALDKVQNLSNQLAEQEARYSTEASGLRRLVTMMEEREKQAKDIVEGIEREWAEVGDRAERREAALKEEVEKEKHAREVAEKRVEQLETVMDKMGRGELPVPGRSMPSTPIRTPGRGDFVTEGILGLSPTVAMASRAQRAGKTFTEVYADYVRLQEDYAKKSAEYDHMDRTLTAVLAQIEERAPILSQQRAEYERLQSEASQLASQLSQALAERDTQASLSQEVSQKLSKSTAENELLQKQLEDLGRQVQSLLREIARRDDPTIPNDQELEQIPYQPGNDVDTVITNNLVLFKSIGQLQDQNQRLLKIVRELAAKMESEEREYKEALEKEQSEAIKEAHEAMQELADQLERQKKHSESVIQAYVKERDALRGMLARAEKATGRSLINGIGGETVVGDIASDSELARELADVQSQFDAYRAEMGTDSTKLREQLIFAQREVSTLEASLAKANARIEYLTDRNRMHQEQFTLHGREIDDLTKRNQQLFDQWTRMDIECNRVTEDLHASNARVEQLRNECANLRAEKKIWESVQMRLVEENKTLALERSHLSDLMSNVQRMHNDLERSGENDRRRLESQLQMLESQAQDLRSQVSHEREAVRNLSLQKDIELKELQGRLDKNAQDFSKTREALVGAETSKKHLEERVEELTRQLNGIEGKLSVYERRSGTATVTTSADPELSREQQLEAEVAELRSSLKIAEVDLASARSHVQQFQEISAASEEALSALNATYDEYKASTEAQIARHESEQKALEEKLHSAQEEVSQLKEKLSELQTSFDTERTAWASDRKTLEGTIIDMTTSEKHVESDRTNYERDIQQLEARVKSAEERYSHEVLAHAELIKAAEKLKRELSSTQAKARDSLTAAESAQAKLATSETSWKQQKEALDKEVADLNARCQDLSAQNKLLHQHLESVSSTATRIRQTAESSGGETAESDAADDAKLSELRSVVAYLRKEKEIVDLQLELSKQEGARLKTQVDHLSQSLQETRATLSEERERAVESAASAAQHAELVERINQLNILRESNATLRADSESNAKKARELEAKLNELTEQLEPAKEQARLAQAELEANRAQIERLEQESRSWQERNAHLLSKYDRIDPAEVQGLKDEIERLKAQAEAAETAKAELEGRAKKIEATLQKQRELDQKNLTIFKSVRDEKTALKAHVKELETKITELEAAKTAAEGRADNAAKTATEAQAAASTSSEDATQQAAMIASLREERDKLLAEKESWTATASSVTDAAQAVPAPDSWEREKEELVKARDELVEKLKTVEDEAEKAKTDAKNVRVQNEKLMTRVRAEMEKTTTAAERAAKEQADAVSAAIEKTKNELQNAVATSPSQDDLIKKHAEELKALEERLKVQYEEQVKAAVEAAVKDRPKGGLSEEEKKAQETKHDSDIAAAVERGRMELSTKLKVKDSQLVKAQTRVKQLEGHIQDLVNKGIIPAATPAATAPPVTPTSTAPSTAGAEGATKANPQMTAKPTVPAANKPATGANPALAKATAAAAAGGSTALPRKPMGATGRGGAPGVRGAAPGRGGAVQRGGAPRVLPTKLTTPTTSTGSTTTAAAAGGAGSPASASAAGGMSIMGAAAKRPREEGAQGGEDSLAKRLKPAEGAGKPVTIRRPPPPTS